jgi:hypothetical protein
VERRSLLDLKGNVIVWITACNLVRSRLNGPCGMKRMWPRPAIHENSAAAASVVVVHDEIGLSIRGAE